MELRPGISFDIDEKTYTYVGVRADSEGTSPQVVARAVGEEGLHTLFAPKDLEVRASNFWIGTQELTHEGLVQQYEGQVDLLKKTGIVRELSSGAFGITGIDGKEYPVPQLEDIQRHILEHPEKYREKIDQGFNKPLLVPFGAPLELMLDALRKSIEDHFVEAETAGVTKEDEKKPLRQPDPEKTRLFYTDGKPVLLDLEPLAKQYVNTQKSDFFEHIDRKNYLLYFPEDFSRDPKGKFKSQILSENDMPFPGWSVILIQDVPNPRPEQEKGGRVEYPFELYPEEYIEGRQQKTVYRHERFLTPEDWIIYQLVHLEEMNELIDDTTTVYLLGCMFDPNNPDYLNMGSILFVGWDGGFERPTLDDNEGTTLTFWAETEFSTMEAAAVRSAVAIE